MDHERFSDAKYWIKFDYVVERELFTVKDMHVLLIEENINQLKLLVICLAGLLHLCRFLMEIGALVLVDENGAGLSLESVYRKLAEEKNGCCWEYYEVYKHLKSLGYIVGRHAVPWTLKSVKTDVAAEEKFIVHRLSKLDLNGLEPAFDVYLPNGKFKKSSPGDPSYVLCFTRYWFSASLFQDTPILQSMVKFSKPDV